MSAFFFSSEDGTDKQHAAEAHRRQGGMMVQQSKEERDRAETWAHLMGAMISYRSSDSVPKLNGPTWTG